MPVTARLSKLFYERLGEEVTNELVDWFNAVDATYRGELKELNELNFARFDAKVGQRFAESEARTDRRFAEFEAKLERRFLELEARVDTKLDSAVAQHAFAQIESRMERGFAEARANMESGLKKQTNIMFGAWSLLLIAIIGLRFLG